MNDDAIIYSKHSYLQKRDAIYILDKYSKSQKWHNGGNILDVGAGEGTVSFEAVLPKLPNNFQKFVLSDISQELLNFARGRCRDERVDFLQMDISCTIPENLYQHFDHIFSFNCMQWVTDEKRQEQAWTNFFDLLKPGGDIFVTLVASGPQYDFSENMAKMEKWAPFMQNVQEVISPYHHLENPAGRLKHLLEKSGFVVSVCEMEEFCYGFTKSDFLEWCISVNPFIKSLPEHEHAAFFEELKRQFFKSEKMVVERDESGNEIFYKKYKIVIACASRP